MNHILYGCAYYDEYMPEERLYEDMDMMVKAGINTIRIAESTWSTEEPSDDVFDFSHVTRTIEAAASRGISVIVGTPTYAIPPWLAAKYPDILAVTEKGPGKYGARQIMDITHPGYRMHAERIIRKLMEAVQPYDNVIGFQLDNETKHYHTAGPRVQELFREWMKQRFGTVAAMNEAYGFAYWSNAVDCWENLPDPTGTINGSYLAAFEEFRRGLVTEFLLWQRSIVDEYRREEQFVTHNFDFEWRGISFGIQPDVDHRKAGAAVTLTGCDIYHPTQEDLTGKEIGFCGAAARSIREDNYIVLETEAQGFEVWTPYDGQLRLQTFSHLASGADGVMYWHWHSLHNSFETYWKGILSHDLKENREYREVSTIGNDLKRMGEKILHLKKRNKVAILVSNAALTAMGDMPCFPLPGGTLKYNDVVRAYADALHELNVEFDVVFPDSENYGRYELLVVPALYSADEALLQRLKDFAAAGGTLLGAVKLGFTDENVKVYHDAQPHLLSDAFGVTYQEFTVPRREHLVACEGFCEAADLADAGLHTFMELLQPMGAKVLASYSGPHWEKYAAITEQKYGEGTAVYVGCLLSADWTKAVLRHALRCAGVSLENADLMPVAVKSGVNMQGENVRYYLNYSYEEQKVPYRYESGTEILSEEPVEKDSELVLPPWGVKIVVSK